MFVDKDGTVYEYTDVYDNGRVIVHHHGTKKLTPEQNERFSEIMSRAWDSIPEERQIEILKKVELERKTKWKRTKNFKFINYKGTDYYSGVFNNIFK